MTMEMTVQKVLGELGEYYATTYLNAMGIRTCRADKINWVGHSLLYKIHYRNLTVTIYTPWLNYVKDSLNATLTTRHVKTLIRFSTPLILTL